MTGPGYTLRDIPPDLWTRVRVKALQDGLPVRSVLLQLLAAYDSGEVVIKARKREVTKIAIEALRKATRHLASCQVIEGRWFCAGDCPHHVIVDVDAERD